MILNHSQRFPEVEKRDYEGLTREFFTELFIGAEGQVLQGPPEKMSILIRNLKKFEIREYFVYGMSIGLALL